MEAEIDEFVITTVGRISSSDEDDTFRYKSVTYKKLIHWDGFNRLIHLRKQTGFYFKQQIINDVIHLVLYYSNNAPAWDRIEKNFLVQSFFDEIEDEASEQSGEHSARELTLDEFYEKLRESHEDDDLEDGIPAEVQHLNLKPVLRPYQVKGIKWMLKRELQTDNLPSTLVKLRSKFNSNQIVNFDKHSQFLFFGTTPELYKVPSGGILADEMGLGKTVEVLGLILMNPRRMKRKIEEVDEADETDDSFDKPLIRKSGKIKCFCQKQKRRKKLIQCPQCKTSQHIECMFHDAELACSEGYLCPFCWKVLERTIDAKTTFIVTPASIKNQWKDEIQKHIGGNFKTLMYKGISSGWISPSELVKYDVVITDFNTLSRELYFAKTAATDRSLRHIKKFEYPLSPLKSIRWWRVVLDEAQMVENKNNRPSQMVKQMPAVNRWATTGTPVEKDSSLHSLYGLIFFLNVEPFTNEKIFNQLFNGYKFLGKQEEFISIISKIMWRTSKIHVENEINIPKQTEVFHAVEMTDLMECFYRQVHAITKPKFFKNVTSYIERNSPYELVPTKINGRNFTKRKPIFDWTLKGRFLYQLNNATLKIFIEPLRQLRQDCTIPGIFTQSTDQTRTKQILRPEQLHEHLVSKASLEAKSALRTICSSINGIAAIKIAEKKYDEAIVLYQQVLRWAGDYTGFVAVDSMLQIHSYNSLMDVASVAQIEDELKKREEYAEKMHQLEWKYISKYYVKVEAIRDEMIEMQPELRKAKKEFTDLKGFWWREIIYARRTNDQEVRFNEIINLEVLTSIGVHSQVFNELRSMSGIELIITEWSDKIFKYTTEVKESFKKLEFFVSNLQPFNKMNSEDQEKLMKLAKSAFDCHLNLRKEEEENVIAKKKVKRKKCFMCTFKMKLNEYECSLFNKALSVDEETVEGTWNPRLEEKVMKAILSYARRVDFSEDFVTVGQNFFTYLDALKKQYKLQAQLWVEVNYTVSAYDELNMCKMRMEVVDSPEQMTEEDVKYKLKIMRYETEEQIETFAEQKREAEVNFTRLNGRLKYLEHLKDRNEPPLCPICTNPPVDRYFVTICGHSVCAECFLVLTKNRQTRIKCPVCRTDQEVKNIFIVTRNKGSEIDSINGSYSPKIDDMIRCILGLKKDEPTVKILIFSYWDSILQAIATGLGYNNIEFRASYSSNFAKQISEFKEPSQNITCMLLNLKFGGKGLNLIEATHVILVEPILNAGEELQAISRVHRIGQTRETFVHRFITKNTIEHAMYNKIIQEKEKWMRKEFTINDLEELLDETFGGDENVVDLLL